MNSLYIQLNAPIPAAFSHELGKRLFYVSDRIAGFSLVEEDGLIRGVEIEHRGEEGVEGLASKIDYIVNTDILPQKQIPAAIVWRSRIAPSYHPDVFRTLLDKGIAFEPGPGLVGFGEPLISLMQNLDAMLRQIAVDEFQASEYQYPTLIPAQVLEELDYFTSFPQFGMFVTRLHNDVDVYRAFLADYRAHGGIPPSLFAHCQNHDYCLPPTMCYHTFHQLRECRVPENRVVTSRGKSFRFESIYARGLERLWDFTIREIVFLGTREFVVDCRQRMMRRAQALIEELELFGHCEVANDPFFVGSQTASKIFSQKLMELKYELRVNIDPEQSIAVGSFNYHDTFFGQRFRMSADGRNPLMTGCVGFGLERLMYAWLCQHGLDEAKIKASIEKLV